MALSKHGDRLLELVLDGEPAFSRSSTARDSLLEFIRGRELGYVQIEMSMHLHVVHVCMFACITTC